MRIWLGNVLKSHENVKKKEFHYICLFRAENYNLMKRDITSIPRQRAVVLFFYKTMALCLGMEVWSLILLYRLFPQPEKQRLDSHCWSKKEMNWWRTASFKVLWRNTASVWPSNPTNLPSTPTGKCVQLIRWKHALQLFLLAKTGCVQNSTPYYTYCFSSMYVVLCAVCTSSVCMEKPNY